VVADGPDLQSAFHGAMRPLGHLAGVPQQISPLDHV